MTIPRGHAGDQENALRAALAEPLHPPKTRRQIFLGVTAAMVLVA